MNKYRTPDLVQVGLRIRNARQAHKMTLDTLARQTRLSKGLLSKIENFRTIPSLPVLAAIARSLSIDPAELVRGIGQAASLPYVLIPRERRLTVKRDNAIGFLYQSLLTRDLGDRVFEGFVLTLQPHARRAPVTTDGTQFVFMLQGRVQFQIGADQVVLRPGDALFFDGRRPHVPRNPYRADAVLLAIYLIQPERK